MEIDKPLTCRLCLKRCGCGFELIEDTIRDIFKILLLDLDLRICNKSVVCYTCLESLVQCFDTKADYVQKNDTMVGMNIVPGSGNMCHLCMESISRGDPMISLNKKRKVADMLEKHFELASNGTHDSMVCMPCYGSLQHHFTFISNCLAVEKDIRDFCEVRGADNNGQIELSDVLSFVTENTYEKNHSCSEVRVIENSEVETRDESSVEIEENQVTIDPENIETRFEQIHHDRTANAAGQDTNISIAKSSAPAFYKCYTCTYQSFSKNDLRQHIDVHTSALDVTSYKCGTCTFETTRKRYLRKHKMFMHKSAAEITMHKCTICAFQTKYPWGLSRHMLQHCSSSEVEMFKCGMCPYQSHRKSTLQNHMLVHKSASEVTMYKCEPCGFETKKKLCLRQHMYAHQHASNIKPYACKLCTYKASHKRYLHQHILIHKSPSEVTMYKCEICAYETKRKGALKSHALTHKSSTEVEIHKCKLCAFQSKFKNSLKKHLLTHQSAEVRTLKCDKCLFQTKDKAYLRKHVLAHQSNSEVK